MDTITDYNLLTIFATIIVVFIIVTIVKIKKLRDKIKNRFKDYEDDTFKDPRDE
jgi:ABC-type bacteriocin/lantibiotic exporter with double-glycine peptidase domain